MIQDLHSALAIVANTEAGTSRRAALHFLSSALCSQAHHPASSAAVESARKIYNPLFYQPGADKAEHSAMWVPAIEAMVSDLVGGKSEDKRDAITCLAEIVDKSEGGRQVVMDLLKPKGVQVTVQYAYDLRSTQHSTVVLFKMDNTLVVQRELPPAGAEKQEQARQNYFMEEPEATIP